MQEDLSGAIAQFFATLSIKVDKRAIEASLKTIKETLAASENLFVKVHAQLDTIKLKQELAAFTGKIKVDVDQVRDKAAKTKGKVIDALAGTTAPKINPYATTGAMIRAADIHANMVKDVGPNKMENMLNQADHLKKVMVEMEAGSIDLSKDFKGRLIPSVNDLATSLKKLESQIDLLRTQNLSPKATKAMVGRVQGSSKELEALLPIMGAENAKSMAAVARKRLADISALGKAGTGGFDVSKGIFESVIKQAAEFGQGKAKTVNTAAYEKTLKRLKEHAAQVEEGVMNLHPTQRGFGRIALPQLKADMKIFSPEDQKFIGEYEKILASQTEIAKVNKDINQLKREEHKINQALAKDESTKLLKKAGNFREKVKELESVQAYERRLLNTMYEQKYGAGPQDADKFKSLSRSREYLDALPRRGPNTGALMARQEALLLDLQKQEVSLKEKIVAINATISQQEVGSIAHKLESVKLQQMENRLAEVRGNISSNEQAKAVLASRQMELTIRNNERSLGGFLQRTRAALTGIRDLMNNIFVPLMAFSGAMQIDKTITAISSVKSSLTAITGSAEAGAEEFAFLDKEAARLGVTLEGVGKEYTKLVASTTLSGIDKQVTRDLFSGVSQAATVFNLDDQEVGRILTAFGQIASKGKVMSEELKGQVAESLPGALKMAADSMQVSTDQLMEMMKRGELSAKDFLGKFSSYMKNMTAEQFKQVENSYAMQKRRLKKAFEDFKRGFGDEGMENFFSKLMMLGRFLLRILLPVIKIVGDAFSILSDIMIGPVIRAAERIFNVLDRIFNKGNDLSKGMKQLQKDILAISIVLAPIMIIFRRFFMIAAIIEIVLLLIDDVMTFFRGGDSVTGDFVKAVKEAFYNLVKEIADSLGALAHALDDPEWLKEHPLVAMFKGVYDSIRKVVDLLLVDLPAAFDKTKAYFGFGTDKQVGESREAVRKTLESWMPSWMQQGLAFAADGINATSNFAQSQMERLSNPPTGSLGSKSSYEGLLTVRVEGNTPADKALAGQLAKGIEDNHVYKKAAAEAGGVR
jgi:tape measure domain-containing protein